MMLYLTGTVDNFNCRNKVIRGSQAGSERRISEDYHLEWLRNQEGCGFFDTMLEKISEHQDSVSSSSYQRSSFDVEGHRSHSPTATLIAADPRNPRRCIPRPRLSHVPIRDEIKLFNTADTNCYLAASASHNQTTGFLPDVPIVLAEKRKTDL
ncbi:hypothetical protein K0M31_007032 [Melipona bicolor]|uniref:Uncharacterized protein n=1 Tax=Melipona bicolor TaxID=60889 RepID=A0AA40FRI3_9HYME|nr:hypothetical protein K0M31_007032 [Melipona bicolor]